MGVTGTVIDWDAMIFATVGTQLPFDRLIRSIDVWAGSTPGAAVFAQIGRAAYRPTNIEWASFLSAAQFRQRFESASLIVAHAGIGTLLMARQAQKPLIMMPRRVALKEGRNDHQLATGRWLRQLPGVIVVDDAEELENALRCGEWQRPGAIRDVASLELLAAVSAFIEEEP